MEQGVIEHIKSSAQTHRAWLNNSRRNDADAIQLLISSMEKIFLGEQTLTDNLINSIKLSNSHELHGFIDAVISPQKKPDIATNYWSSENPLIQKLIHRKHYNYRQQNKDGLSHHVSRYIYHQLTAWENLDLKKFISFLHAQQFSDEDIIIIGAEYPNPYYLNLSTYSKNKNYKAEANEVKITKFSEYLLPLLQPSKGFLGFNKNDGFKNTIDSIVFGQGAQVEKRMYWLSFLLDYYPESLENQYLKFLLYKDYQSKLTVDLNSLLLLLERDPQKFESIIVKAMQEGYIGLGEKFSVTTILNDKLNGKYNNEIISIGEEHFRYYNNANYSGGYFYEPTTFFGSFNETYTNFLLKQGKNKAKDRIEKLFREAIFLNPSFFEYVNEKFGVEALPFFIEALTKDPAKMPSYSIDSYYKFLFAILELRDLTIYIDNLIAFAVTLGGKKSRELACRTIGRYSSEAIKKASLLLTEKTIDQRVTGALILSAIGNEEADRILNGAVDKENNDDTRDIMLEALHDTRFARPYTHQQVLEMVAKAETRKKLSRWNEKWIEEEKLPKLYWAEFQTPLHQNDIRFLFYRMKRAQGLNSDIEAKQLINLLDKEKSQAFAKAILVAFQDSNADIKLKYYLTLAGLLGQDDMMHNLNTLFKKNMADKRMKMAEYVVGALAMVGTDKALRNVEVIYRKFATKKPTISKAAQEALTAAASELNITMDELSDRIIPNFDFEGLYKKFSVDDEEYRAFINSDFKLNYFSEDNKIRKSLPSNVSKELKAAFKEIEKEINDVIKSQSGRLEKYMLEERRWRAADWKTFFFENPIMFVYALKLVWGVFDADGNLVTTFYCSEDTSLYDLHDEEVSIDDEHFVGIVHPIHLTNEIIKSWKDKVYAMNMITIFPIFERNIFVVDDAEKEQSSTKKFFDITVPKGADFVNTFLVKQQWIKSTGDGGSSEFTKNFRDGKIRAYASIEGPAAYYQGGNTPAKVYEISFMKKNWSDKVALKDVPPIFYSEVISDIDQLIKAI